MSFMSREKFLEEYVFEVDAEFERNGNAAEWAPSSNGGAQHWGQEISRLKLVDTDPGTGLRPESAAFALSDDGLLMAVATNKVIRIYSSWDQHLEAELVGHLENVTKVFFAPKNCYLEESYTLLSEAEHYSKEKHNPLILWHIDGGGRLITRTMPFAIDSLADKALGAIKMDLTTHHELPASSMAEVRKSLVNTLKIADTKNRSVTLTTLPGSFPGFGSKVFSSDKKLFLHLEHNNTTQSGMRPPDQLPQVVIRSLNGPETEMARLQGHEDAIMWACFSPTDPNVFATAAWDKTYQIWNLEHKTSSSIIGPTVGQNWSGDFSPDGKHVLLSGTNNVGVYSVATGDQVAKLERPKLEAWVRNLEWSPAGDAVALCNGIEILLWEPFREGEERRSSGMNVVKLTKPENRVLENFMRFHAAKWLDRRGRRLAVMAGDGTVMVWDRKENWKWRFQRPQGRAMKLWTHEIVYVEETEMLYVLDGDRKVRRWRLS
ncbi:hypothetical protein DOTSEDRAFT_22110 [Dothistroma septosporum NZE10]|uniref:Uncharacterized protein n=1 Tax=Dothistroma septosporum (strain NZE10 / CBS 128990) TaxID=675120 RepID=N1PRH4_DOTSN|nr:hypothetical protein DOTSEDRAFT_22110 [Dothistroma septosporum NZE10]